MDSCGITPLSLALKRSVALIDSKGIVGKSGEFGVTEEINYSYAHTHMHKFPNLKSKPGLERIFSSVVWMDLYVQKCWRSKTERLESLHQKCGSVRGLNALNMTFELILQKVL